MVNYNGPFSTTGSMTALQIHTIMCADHNERGEAHESERSIPLSEQAAGLPGRGAGHPEPGRKHHEGREDLSASQGDAGGAG